MRDSLPCHFTIARRGHFRTPLWRLGHICCERCATTSIICEQAGRLPCPAPAPRDAAPQHPLPDATPFMRLSRYFLPVMKEPPADAQIVSHKLMLRAGLIRQTAAGIYAWLPLGLGVLKRIEQIGREEQDRAGAVELPMPTIQPADLWKDSGRYDAYGPEMLRFPARHGREMLFGPT